MKYDGVRIAEFDNFVESGFPYTLVYRDSDNERYFVYIEVLKTKKKNMLSV